jgi:hypothetical protein
VIDDRNAVAGFRFVHVVRGHEQRQSLFLSQVLQEFPNPAAGLRVEAQRRLIQEQDGGSMQERPRKLQSALHSTRERFDNDVCLFR